MVRLEGPCEVHREAAAEIDYQEVKRWFAGRVRERIMGLLRDASKREGRAMYSHESPVMGEVVKTLTVELGPLIPID
jgi:hypothetical protein